MISLPERFWAKVDVRGPDDCWPWLASLRIGGYGQFNTGRNIINAHIVAYDLQTGTEIPKGFEHDHKCRNRVCMNARHIEGVTKLENILRGESPMAKQARQTHCIAGHSLSGSNVFWYGPRKSHRMCLTCKRRRQATPEYLRWRRERNAERRRQA